MTNELKMNRQETIIQGVLAEYLSRSKTVETDMPHLDHDTLAAFTEGSLNEREMQPIVSHLVGCGFCREITADLIRLDLELAGEAVDSPSIENVAQPTRISEVLTGILAKMFGSAENAVFAHNEEEKKENDDEKDKKEKL